MRFALLLVLLLCAACGDGVRPAAPAEAPWFADVAEAAGIRFRHERGVTGRFLLPEIMGGGCGFLDYDGDGRLDVYLVQSGALDPPRERPSGNRLFRNEGSGRFADVSAQAGAPGSGYGMGCAAGDYDNDGDADLFVTSLGPNALYRNDGGRFTDVTAAAGVGAGGWSTSAAFVDYDADGFLDLFVCQYVDWQDTPAFLDRKCFALSGVQDYCSPQAYDAHAASRLYRNRGDGTFQDVSAASGVASKRGCALGIVCTDLDGDGRVDLYVANDQMFSHAWINQGDGTFVEAALEMGIAVSETGKSQAGMGVVSADLDDDGRFDLWKVHLYREGHVFYRNRGGSFEDATARLGLLALTRRFTGFGTNVFDVDLDGLLDIFVANGRVEIHADLVKSDDPYAEEDQLIVQRAKGVFVDASAQGGPSFRLLESGRGAAFGDYDDDGDLDVLVANCGGAPRLLRNDAPRKGVSLVLRVLDKAGRDAYGAHVTVRNERGDCVRVADVRAAFSYLATNDPRVFFGLGPDPGALVAEVVWPAGGGVERFGPLRAGAPVTLAQGTGAATR